MALTVIDRPNGRILESTGVTATVSSSSGALFTKTAHGLVSGDYIFIDSVFSHYNGYWYVEQMSVDTFKIKAYSGALAEAFVNSGSVTYYKNALTHGWSCVHLPIVYKLSSNLWPTNSADTIRTVSSISNDAGYVNLNLSGDIKATGSAAELEFVKVTGQNAGIYQIINWISDSDITIDFPYSAGVSFSASQVQYYYKNYSVRVRVYAGLNSSHYWAGQKAHELIVELDLVPDEDGIVTVNIADYIKSKIAIDKNNTALDTLPNDIDSFCQFYIETAEAYTYSNGYTLGTNVTSYTSDQGNFEGYASNSVLPFKTQSSGFMSEYIMAPNFVVVNDTGFTSGWVSVDGTRPWTFSASSMTITLDVGLSSDTATKAISMSAWDRNRKYRLLVNGTQDASSNFNIAITAGSLSYSLDNTSTTWQIDTEFFLSAVVTSVQVVVTNNGASPATIAVNDIAIYSVISTTGKFLTPISSPSIFSGQYFDISFIINGNNSGNYVLEQRILNGAISHTLQTAVVDNDAGVYRHQITYDATYDSVRVSVYDVYNTLISEIKTITMDKDCSSYYTDLVWKNHLGGHDYWRFNAGSQYSNNIKNKETSVNIFTNWPKSYGKFADTIKKNSMVEGVKTFLIRSQFVTNQQAEDIIFGVENALLVQIQTSETEKRTVLVDGSNKLEETDKLVELQFRLKFTDDNPVQSL